MSQSVRQEARRLAHAQLVRRREELAAREARIGAHVLDAWAAVLERDQVIGDAERRIGQAVYELTVTESVPALEAAALCGLDVREVNRMVKARKRTSSPTVDDSGPAGPSPL